MKNIRRFVVATILVFVSSHVSAQRVKVSNDDPRWGETITVSYTAPDTSQFAHVENRDTLFCAVIVYGSLPEHAMLLPMRRITGGYYETKVTVPDSTHSLWVDICVPTNRVPNGITQFTCRTRDGHPIPSYIIDASTSNIDSALSGTPGNTASRHLALGELYVHQGKDSLANIEFQFAAQTQNFDPIFNEPNFWNSFFAPIMKEGGGMKFPDIPGRIIAPLIERNLHTTMASIWLERMAYDTLMSASIYRDAAAAWNSSKDVDLLLSIAQGFGYEKSPMYDPAVALDWCNRAEVSSRNKDGFYSGENIFGSMDRLPRILALKVQLLAATGKIDEATATEHTGMEIADQQYQKQSLSSAMAKAYLEAGRIDDAKQAYGIALAMSTNGQLDGLKDLYAKCKQGQETIQEFSKRLTDSYGNTVQLPIIPDFSYTTLDGLSGSLSALRGKVVVLDCWFISCAGCEIEKNSLNKLVESFHGDTNVVFLSIATDGEKSLRSYLEHAESKFQIVPNGYDICQKLGVNGFPTHIILGKDGKTLGFEMGGNEHQDEQMRPKIEQALEKM